MRRLWFLFFLFAFPAQAADAMVLSCIPVRSGDAVQIDVYLDAFANGTYPPKTFESVRVLSRFGEDVYEFNPGQAKEVSLRDSVLRIHLVQPLSAGETAEMRLEGKIAAKRNDPFTVEVAIRNERRSGKGQARCTIE